MEVILTDRRDFTEQRIGERPLLVLPYIPDGADELVGDLFTQDGPDTKYLPSVVCKNCQQQLPLQQLDTVEWRAGEHKFYVGPVPGYECQPCEESYFPRRIVTLLIECINLEIGKLNLGSPIPILPLSGLVNLV